MGFQHIIGHERQRAQLQSAILKDKVHHAWLFVGPLGVGCRTLAISFAQALNCARQDGNACGICSACTRIAANGHPDLQILGEDRSAPLIKIEEIRERVLRFVSFRVLEARYRVILVLDCERMNPSAANALLKTLEEPPRQTVFVLTARNLNALLPTIRSRCQKLRFAPLSPALVAEHLERAHQMEPERASLLANLSEGSLGRALSLGNDQLEARTAVLDGLLKLNSSRANHALAIAAELSPDRQSLQLQLGYLERFFRDAALRCVDSQAPLHNPDLREHLERFAAPLSLPGLLGMLKVVEDSRIALRLNLNPIAILENLLLEVTRIQRAHR